MTQTGSGFLCVFASLLLCVSHAKPSLDQRGPCYGKVLRKGLGSPPLEGDNLLLKNHISEYQSISRFDGIERELPGVTPVSLSILRLLSWITSLDLPCWIYPVGFT